MADKNNPFSSYYNYPKAYGEAPPEEAPSEPQKLKIDIPETPFEPDVNQVKDRLKQILQNWKKFGKANPNDIVTLIKYLDGEK